MSQPVGGTIERHSGRGGGEPGAGVCQSTSASPPPPLGSDSEPSSCERQYPCPTCTAEQKRGTWPNALAVTAVLCCRFPAWLLSAASNYREPTFNLPMSLFSDTHRRKIPERYRLSFSMARKQSGEQRSVTFAYLPVIAHSFSDTKEGQERLKRSN